MRADITLAPTPGIALAAPRAMRTRSLYVIALSAVAFVACVPEVAPLVPASRDPGTMPLDRSLHDMDVNDAVGNALTNRGGLGLLDVTVSTHDGIVTLTGEVASLYERDRASAIAETVRGVRAVVNRLVTNPLGRRDEDLAAEVTRTLAKDRVARTHDLVVTVDVGVVQLDGYVASFEEKALLSELVESVPGVRGVQSLLRVKPSGTRTDSEIQAEIVRRLHDDVWIDPAALEVDVTAGVVVVRGVVGSASERTRAARDSWVNGVRSVDATAIRVDVRRRDRYRRSDAETRTDAEIATAVSSALSYDPRIAPREIDVRSTRGVVTMSGVVADMQAAKSAEEDAWNTYGVREVVNRLEVRALPDDLDIEQHVTRAIRYDPKIDSTHIRVSSEQGKVVLEGVVGSLAERREAGAVAANIPTVLALQNDLMVLELTPRSEEDLRRAIELSLRWDSRAELGLLTVHVLGRTAVLTGTVESRRDLRIAVDDARDVGAEDVVVRVNIRNLPKPRD